MIRVDAAQPMSDAYLIDAVRTPTGRRGGRLSAVHPGDLGAHVFAALLERTGVPPEAIDDVIIGCGHQIGAQALNVARQAWLAGGFPESVPGVTIDRQCGSSLQAAHFAVQGVWSGTADLVIAGGIENMSMIPIGSPTLVGDARGLGHPNGSEGFRLRYGDQEISQFRGAELMADRWGLTRDDLDRFSLGSHQRATAAWKEGRFNAEVVPYDDMVCDEGFRPEASLEKMAALAPLPGRTILTAAHASQIADGASAVLVASAAAVERHGLRPRARVHALALAGSDPVMMLTGPIDATAKVLGHAGLSVGEIDLFEVNEAFAPVVLAWAMETGASLARTNVNGGAIALGHPIGATGTKLLATLLGELERTGGRYGLVAICEGGGLANAAIVERLD